MKLHRSLFWVFLLFLIALSLIACNLTVASKTQFSALQVVYDPWPGFLPLVIAQEKGFFTQQGVKVEAFLTENSATKIPEFTAGKYDGITLALGSVVTSNAASPNIRIIFGIDRSDGADAVISPNSDSTGLKREGDRHSLRWIWRIVDHKNARS